MSKVKTLVRKEILDILRDKKTLIVMVVVPMLLYPLIIIGMSLIFSTIMRSQEDGLHVVGYQAEDGELAQRLEQVYEKNKEELELNIEFQGAVSGEEQTAKEEADVWLEMAETPEGVSHVIIDYASTDQGSLYTKQAMEELLELYREELLEQNLEAEGLDESFLHPVTYETEDSASLSESMGMDIGGSIGLMLIVTIMLGAVYPAIDATAGEKERGTLETLLTLPVTNFQMILSKYVSVALFACVTAVLSVLSLGGSVLFLMFGLSSEVAEEMQGFSLTGVLAAVPVLLLLLLVTALLAAALCMSFCIFAKSFKEANNYVTPLLLVVMFAAMVGMVPSITLDYRTALIPIVNVSLLVKQMISQQFDLVLAGTAICVNFGCSILIIWILAKMYDSENILFADGFRSFRVFQKRSEIEKGTVPDIGDLVISITVLFLLILYVGSAAAVRLGFWGTAVNQLLILLVPLAMVWYMKSDVRNLFSFRAPRWRTVPGSILLYLGTYCLVLGLGTILSRILPASAENVEAAFLPMTEQALPVLLLVTAVMPAIGEEILFRGFLFGSLRRNMKKRGWAIVISALIFGAFHVSLVKLLPTALLGASFACIVSATGSIYVTMFLHFLNNTISMAVLKYPEAAMRLVPFLAKEQMEPAELAVLMAVGAAAAAAGSLLMRKSGKR